MLQDILICSKVLQDYYQFAHWCSKNTVFYVDHLMFSRLYDEAGKHIDGLAEKMLGTGCPCSELDTPILYKKAFDKLKDLSYTVKENIEFAKDALPLEEELIACCVEVDSNPKTSLGIKNFVGAIADDAENRIYLLKQRMNTGASEKKVSLNS